TNRWPATVCSRRLTPGAPARGGASLLPEAVAGGYVLSRPSALHHSIQPADQIVADLITDRLIEQFVPGFGIKMMLKICHASSAIRLQPGLKLLRISAHRITPSSDHINRKVPGNAPAVLRR